MGIFETPIRIYRDHSINVASRIDHHFATGRCQTKSQEEEEDLFIANPRWTSCRTECARRLSSADNDLTI